MAEIELPSLVPMLEQSKSGAAIKGIGEKLSANLATGTANFSVPSKVTNARDAPPFKLNYRSGCRNALTIINRYYVY